MCCSDLSYKGGMVSVVRGYLESPEWADGDWRVTFIPTHRDASRAGLLACFARAVSKIAWMGVRGRIDVAHLHVSERGSFLRKGFLVKMLRKMGIPVVLHHHGAEFDDYYAAASPRVKRFVAEVLAEADVNIVLSERLRDSITSKAPGARVEAVYNSVVPVTPNPYDADGTHLVTLLGRLGKRKGAYDLLEAIARTDAQLPADIRFCLCGDGEVSEVEARIDTLGVRHRIAHVGWVDGEQKERILADTMINVLPSYHEGLPMTILETMGRGIPSISTPVASIPEVVKDGENGYLVEPGDVDALADRILTLATSSETRRRFSAEAHALISSRFTLPKAIARLKEIYSGIMK